MKHVEESARDRALELSDSLTEKEEGREETLSPCERRAKERLQSKEKLSNQEVFEILQMAEIPFSDSRKNVLPDGQAKVFQAALGAVPLRIGRAAVIARALESRTYLVRVLCRFMSEQEPGFEFTTVQINKNFACSRHKDGNNDGDSRLIALGNFVGGQLVVWEPGNVRTEETKDVWVSFDGNNYHEVQPYIGDRISLVFFRLGLPSQEKMLPETAECLKRLGFRVPPRAGARADPPAAAKAKASPAPKTAAPKPGSPQKPAPKADTKKGSAPKKPRQ